jgi:hypothetical protein
LPIRRTSPKSFPPDSFASAFMSIARPVGVALGSEATTRHVPDGSGTRRPANGRSCCITSPNLTPGERGTVTAGDGLVVEGVGGVVTGDVYELGGSAEGTGAGTRLLYSGGNKTANADAQIATSNAPRQTGATIHRRLATDMVRYRSAGG